jgi:FlaA1/EpsC-like NDP-sugar epimerase
MRYLIGDVRDLQRLSRAMEDIDFVFHLAAMKHVPFCEYNPFEAVQTNVIGPECDSGGDTEQGQAGAVYQHR